MDTRPGYDEDVCRATVLTDVLFRSGRVELAVKSGRPLQLHVRQRTADGEEGGEDVSSESHVVWITADVEAGLIGRDDCQSL
jgi:hypothetical protein